MPPSAAQRQAILQFQEFTGANEKIATRILKSNGWRVESAVEIYLNQAGVSGPSRNEDAALATLFESFRDANDAADTCGINGILNYFEKLGVNPENVSALVALEIVQAPGMEEMTKSGFVNGWKVNGGANTIAKQKLYVASQTKALTTDPALFRRLYRWTFGFAKENSQKSVMLDMAVVYWNVLFSSPGPSMNSPTTDWLSEWTSYLQEIWKKSVNKDMWNQTLEFLIKAKADDSLSFWTEESAWPSVVDEFVEYMKKKQGKSPEKMEVD